MTEEEELAAAIANGGWTVTAGETPLPPPEPMSKVERMLPTGHIMPPCWARLVVWPTVYAYRLAETS